MLTTLTLIALILGDDGGASMEANQDAVRIFRADFEAEADINYDGWPDNWTRHRGFGYPAYSKVEITRVPDCPDGKRALRMDLDGGAIRVSSPPLEMSPYFSYVLDGWIKTEKLAHNGARISFTLTTAGGKPQQWHSTWEHKTNGWTKVRLGPITPPRQSGSTGMVTLELAPQGKQADLRGTAWFDALELTRLPRMSLETNSELNVFAANSTPEFVCRASGIQQANPQVEFQLLDEQGKEIARQQATLAAEQGASKQLTKEGFAGQVTWKPTLPDVGYYRVRVTMLGDGADWLTRETSVVVVQPQTSVETGDFGWSLPNGDRPLDVGTLAKLLPQTGVHWVKFPLWFADSDTERADRMAWFAERLSINHIALTGVLDQPPVDAREAFREKGELPAATVFGDAHIWPPVVDPVMTRLSLKVRRWQLGADHDASFVGLPDAAERIREIKKLLDRFGQDLKVSVNWKWMHELPAVGEQAPWESVTLLADPPLTAAELTSYLQHTSQASYRRAVQLLPLPTSEYSFETRVRDYVERIIAAKINRADIIYAGKPFDDERGLFNANGTPGELFLVWRTLAHQLSGADYVGTFQLPSGSTNHVFAKDGLATMLVWNDQPTSDSFLAGEEVSPLDLWGRRVEMTTSTENGTKAIPIGSLPILVTGINEYLARSRISIGFVERRLESVFGREQQLVLKLSNPYPHAISGEVRLQAPETWETTRSPLRFRVAEGQELQLSIPVTLGLDASSGPQPVRLDFDLLAQNRSQFSEHRVVQVGLEDVALELQTRVLADNRLQIDLLLNNHTQQPVSFNYTLFPPQRRRETRQALSLPPGRNAVRMLLEDADELVGQRIYLRAEEINGPRVLNQNVVVER